VSHSALQYDPLDFIERNFIISAIIELCRPRAFMRGHPLSVFKEAAVLEIDRDARCPKGMAANPGFNAGLPRPAPRICSPIPGSTPPASSTASSTDFLIICFP
jgi:hypothetical protein